MRGLAVLILGIAVSTAIWVDTVKLGHTPRPASYPVGSGFNVPGGVVDPFSLEGTPYHARAVWQLPVAVLLVFAGIAVALALWQRADESRFPYP